MIGNKIAKKNCKIINNSEIVKNENDKEILKERYISPEERQETIDEMRLIYNNGISKNVKFVTLYTKSSN